MQFAQPIWIGIGIGVCLTLFFLLQKMQSKRLEALERFVSPGLRLRLTRNVSTRKRGIKKVIYLLAIFCCFLAFARPQYGFRWIEVKRKGIDILFALDTSKSMLAEDVKPNRLERAKLAIMDFVGQLESDRVGIMPFAGSAFLMCPLTSDYNAFIQSLTAIDTKIIPKGGTDIATAITGAEAVLNNAANHKLLILITDGENLQGDSLKAAEGASKNEMRIFTVGVGTKEGELIPSDSTGKKGFLKDTNGKFVTSRLDEKTLSRIAEKTDGLYVPLGSGGEGLEVIYQEKLALIPKEELGERRHKVPLERFEWAVAAALIFLLIEVILGGRKTKLQFSLPLNKFSRRIRKKKAGSSLALILLLLISTTPSKASTGEEAYRQGDFLSASEYYSKALEKDPDNYKLHYNYGTTAYKNNLFDDAIASFSTALKSKDLDLQERAYYNRGNAHFQKGVESQQSEPQKTIKQWQDALSSYQACLKLQPKAEDARFNYDLVEKRLKELEKQQEEQKNKENNNDKKEQEKNDQEKEQNQSAKEEENSSQESSKDTPSPSQSSEENEQKKEEEANDASDEAQQKPKDPEDKKNDSGGVANDSDGGQNEQASLNEERRQLGKMTKEEAEQLLDALKNEEGNLNFVPANIGRQDEDPRRDW